MSKILTFSNKSRSLISIVLSIIISVLFVVVIVEAATTISSNISTDGTLSVTGASTLTGVVTAGDNITVPAAYGLDTATAGALNIGTSTATSITIGSGSAATTFNGALIIGADGAGVDVTFYTDTASEEFLWDASENQIVLDGADGTTVFNITDGNLVINDTASTTNLIVGGDSANGTIAGIVFGTCTYNPGGAITASSTLSTNCTGATGVRTGDRVFVTPRNLENNLIFTNASSTVVNVIQVSVYNTGVTGDVSPLSATWDWMAIR